jgi:hypothetical protein
MIRIVLDTARGDDHGQLCLWAERTDDGIRCEDDRRRALDFDDLPAWMQREVEGQLNAESEVSE